MRGATRGPHLVSLRSTFLSRKRERGMAAGGAGESDAAQSIPSFFSL